MDPAGPEFTTLTAPKDLSIDGHLDPTDAKYVQCIHTNKGGLGTAFYCGHGNFVMNSGLMQPGCSLLQPGCSHARALEYFTESLNPNHKFGSYHCENLLKKIYLEFIKQKCSHNFDQMGIHSARKSGNYFVKTNAKPPFARGN